MLSDPTPSDLSPVTVADLRQARLRPMDRAARAGVVDIALRRLWQAAVASTGVEPTGLALAATGSHGRRDGGPTSDLDLLLLHDGTRSAAQVAAVAEALWYPIWDAGLDLDHSVRSLSQCRSVASADLSAAVALLDVRFISGDRELVDRARSAVLADWRSAARRRLRDVLAAVDDRASQFGELAYVVEPDLKLARGGMRDAVIIKALTASWLTDRPHGQFDAAYERLLDVRDALALVTNRHTHRLLRSHHDDVAHRLGMSDGDELHSVVAELGRTISYALDTTVRHARQALQRSSRPRLVRGRRMPPRLPSLARDCVVHDGEVVLAAAVVPEADAELPLRAAAAAARAGLPLSAVTVASLQRCPDLPTPWSHTAREQLLALVRSGPAQIPVWEALDQAGLVTRWLPPWAAVRNRRQHSAVHRFTVDRHLVQTAANLPVGDTSEVLAWAALLHDIGKVPGAADHSVAGVQIAAPLLQRLGVPQAEQADVLLLIRHHLLLAETATSKDLNDPGVLADLARTLDHRADLLRALRTLTQADALAAGPKAWTTWRAALVDRLTANLQDYVR